MGDAPTRGATEEHAHAWAERRLLAFLVRFAALAIPLVAAYLAVGWSGDRLWRPSGFLGLVAWIAQAAAVGYLTAKVVDTQSRRLLPLATLFGMSLVFPDRAPSRFGVALRANTVKRLRASLDEQFLSVDDQTRADASHRAVELITALADHDRLTRGHTERVRAYADLIADEMGLSADEQHRLTWGVLLHDVGKLTVPAEILNKTSKLTDDEWATLRNHPAAGGAMVEPLRDWLGDAVGAASEHHERWDGTGYPNGLAGDEISLAGRITAVADAYDVITSRRSYKAPMSPAAARQELVRCAGTQFDPAVVRAFMEVSLGRNVRLGHLVWLDQLRNVASAASTPVAAGTIALAAAVPTVAPVHDLPAEDLTLALVESVDAMPVATPTSTVVEATPPTPRPSPSPTPAAERPTAMPPRPTPTPGGLTIPFPTPTGEPPGSTPTPEGLTIPFPTPTTDPDQPPATASPTPTPVDPGATTTPTPSTTPGSSPTPTPTGPPTPTPSSTPTPTPTPTATPIEGGVSYGGNVYVEGPRGLSWPEAYDYAASIGGHLVTITDAGENDFIRTTFGVAAPLWLGLTDEDDEGTFEWVTGEPLGYTNWLPGGLHPAEPHDPGGTEDWVAMVSPSGAWADEPSEDPGWFLLIWQPFPPDPVTVVEFEDP